MDCSNWQHHCTSPLQQLVSQFYSSFNKGVCAHFLFFVPRSIARQVAEKIAQCNKASTPNSTTCNAKFSTIVRQISEKIALCNRAFNSMWASTEINCNSLIRIYLEILKTLGLLWRGSLPVEEVGISWHFGIISLAAKNKYTCGSVWVKEINLDLQGHCIGNMMWFIWQL